MVGGPAEAAGATAELLTIEGGGTRVPGRRRGARRTPHDRFSRPASRPEAAQHVLLVTITGRAGRSSPWSGRRDAEL